MTAGLRSSDAHLVNKIRFHIFEFMVKGPIGPIIGYSLTERIFLQLVTIFESLKKKIVMVLQWHCHGTVTILLRHCHDTCKESRLDFVAARISSLQNCSDTRGASLHPISLYIRRSSPSRDPIIKRCFRKIIRKHRFYSMTGSLLSAGGPPCRWPGVNWPYPAASPFSSAC
jgi:hypothetical protein